MYSTAGNSTKKSEMMNYTDLFTNPLAEELIEVFKNVSCKCLLTDSLPLYIIESGVKMFSHFLSFFFSQCS